MNRGQIVRLYAADADHIATSTGRSDYAAAARSLHELADKLERLAAVERKAKARQRGLPAPSPAPLPPRADAWTGTHTSDKVVLRRVR